MITAIRGVVSRSFSWEDYAIQKAISLTISIATAGFGKGGANVPAVECLDDQIIYNSGKQIF
jgi:hypothetical protein